jgi:hypothetical protein
MALEFFNTMMGRTFYEGTVPRIARALEALVENVEKLNEKIDQSTETEKTRIVVCPSSHHKDLDYCHVYEVPCRYSLDDFNQIFQELIIQLEKKYEHDWTTEDLKPLLSAYNINFQSHDVGNTWDD